MTNSRAKSEWDSVITKLADETVNSSTTMQDDDELLATLGVGSYVFEIYAIISTSATPDFKYTVTFGGTATGKINSLNATHASNNFATEITMTGLVDFMSVHIHGHAIVSATGVLTLQWAQNTSDAGATKVLKGSRLFIKKVA